MSEAADKIRITELQAQVAVQTVQIEELQELTLRMTKNISAMALLLMDCVGVLATLTKGKN